MGNGEPDGRELEPGRGGHAGSNPAPPPLLGVALAAAIAWSCGGGSASSGADQQSEVDAEVTVDAASDLEQTGDPSDDFIRGVDISMLHQIESVGGRYFDARGEARDLLSILKERGVNWVRFRLWVDPRDAGGLPLGGGNNDLEVGLALAKRSRDAGMKLLLDLHYSDTWADPAHQATPRSWATLDAGALAKEVYDYTSETLRAFGEAGAFPDMVQVGNEINSGMLWPLGHIYKDESSGIPRAQAQANFVSFLEHGTRAVRDAAQARGVAVKVMLHLADGGDKDGFTYFFDRYVAGVDHDVIGISYYPYWHGTLAELVANMTNLRDVYGKEIVVAETAYAFTLEEGDELANIFGPTAETAGGFAATVENQATVVRSIMDAVRDLGDPGLGVFYWEPAWIPVAGAGWRTGEGNAWENQAMFDFDGRALPSLDVFAPRPQAPARD